MAASAPIDAEPLPRGSPFAAVLWDLDATLLDTEALLDKAVTAAVEKLCGVTPTPAVLLATRGMPDHGPNGWPARTLALLGASASSTTPEALFAETDARFAATCGDADPMPGAYAAVAAVAARGLPQAIVTSSMRAAVALKRVRHEEGIFSPMVGLVTVEDVAPHAKPAPDAYRLGAARLGVDPRACVVVEDSLPGIRAGVAAGCTVVAVPHDHHVDEARALGAAVVLESLEGWDVAAFLAAGVPG